MISFVFGSELLMSLRSTAASQTINNIWSKLKQKFPKFCSNQDHISKPLQFFYCCNFLTEFEKVLSDRLNNLHKWTGGFKLGPASDKLSKICKG